jgi:hypothetical protein
MAGLAIPPRDPIPTHYVRASPDDNGYTLESRCSRVFDQEAEAPKVIPNAWPGDCEREEPLSVPERGLFAIPQ